MTDVMIEAKRLSKRYGDVTALNKATFDVHKGEVLGFLGPNGAGKTTCMKILTCFISPTEGTAKVNGCDVFDDPMGVREALGYLPETNPLYVEMGVLEYLDWVAAMRKLKGEEARKRIRKVVEQTDIGDMIHREIRTLSKGYKQRVGLAAALMHEPPILILDEPMSGLDPNQAVEIRELIKSIGRERTVILSTHNLFEVQLTCDRVLIISEGAIVADDRPDELRARAGKPKYFVSIASDGNGASEKLQKVAGVADVQVVAGSPTGESHFVLTADKSDDLRGVIGAAVAEAGLTLLELGRHTVNLETVFRDLTVGEGSDAKKKKTATKKARAAEKKKAESEKKKKAEEAKKKKAESEKKKADADGEKKAAAEADADDEKKAAAETDPDDEAREERDEAADGADEDADDADAGGSNGTEEDDEDDEDEETSDDEKEDT
jgi:ABC-2 type transport system ATP-binding protein